MTEWKKYINTKEINAEIDNTKHGYVLLYNGGEQSPTHTEKINPKYMDRVTHYLICEPQPHAEMQSIWVKTGQPVEYLVNSTQLWEPVKGRPNWHPENIFRFAQPKKEVIYYRDYLYRKLDGRAIKATVTKNRANNGPEIIKTGGHFIKWLDDEWQELEV